MKWKAAIVLLAVLAGIIVPPSFPQMTASGAQTAIGTLDVCQKAAPSLFSHGDMPFMNECSCQPLPLASFAVPDSVSPLFKPLLLPLKFERPPQA